MTGPLDGCEVLVTRPRERAGALADALRAAGARVVVQPLIQVVPPRDRAALEWARRRVADRDWVVFTSSYGVRALGPVPGEGLPPAACVGSATAESAREAGWRVAVVPEESTGEALARALVSAMDGPRGQRVLFPRAEDAGTVLPRLLREAGCAVDDVVAYRKVVPEDVASLAARLDAGAIDTLTFTSPSTARTFVRQFGTAAAGSRRVVVIGPTTAAAVRSLGLPEPVMAPEATVEGLVRGVVAAFTNEQRNDEHGRQG